MTEIYTGTYGAKRQTFEKVSPRSILLELYRRHPRASDDEINKMFTDRVIDDVEMLRPIIVYWLAGNRPSLKRSQAPSTLKMPKQRQEEITQQSERVEAIKTTIKAKATQLALLNLEVVISKNKKKLLRECSGAECLKAGGWLVSIAKAIKSTEIVGDVLSESKIRKLWASA